MKTVIADIVRKLNVIGSGPDQIIRVEQNSDNTIFEINNKEKTVYGWATLKTTEKYGGFVIRQIPVLLALLNYDEYKSENAKIFLKFNLEDKATSIEFDSNTGTTTSFKLGDPKKVPANKRASNVPADMVFSPDFERIKKFSKLKSIFSTENYFWTHSDGDKLTVGFGQDNNNTNQAKMILHDSNAMKLTQVNYWDASQFLNVLQIDQINTTIKIYSRGLMVIDFDSNDIHYQFVFVGHKI